MDLSIDSCRANKYFRDGSLAARRASSQDEAPAARYRAQAWTHSICWTRPGPVVWQVNRKTGTQEGCSCYQRTSVTILHSGAKRIDSLSLVNTRLLTQVPAQPEDPEFTRHLQGDDKPVVHPQRPVQNRRPAQAGLSATRASLRSHLRPLLAAGGRRDRILDTAGTRMHS